MNLLFYSCGGLKSSMNLSELVPFEGSRHSLFLVRGAIFWDRGGLEGKLTVQAEVPCTHRPRGMRICMVSSSDEWKVIVGYLSVSLRAGIRLLRKNVKMDSGKMPGNKGPGRIVTVQIELCSCFVRFFGTWPCRLIYVLPLTVVMLQWQSWVVGERLCDHAVWTS